ncbi:hypothetical protein GRI55_01530 [Erythrobacter citreus]|uniref:Lipoprotein n=1 Tax=Qipengyuania citrea TaxID=225971 RepID=A0A6I4U748_9SPHN|nr:hypothetical protein [Qipengyuania citrea]MDQ0566085.1 hypothetical protein [Qipengyuania citrea]MXP34448.1 hypothetical protein [Qipengyuania citrea]
MRNIVGLLALSALCACKSEPAFDERYEAAQEQITDKAEELDHDLDNPSVAETEVAKENKSKN